MRRRFAGGLGDGGARKFMWGAMLVDKDCMEVVMVMMFVGDYQAAGLSVYIFVLQVQRKKAEKRMTLREKANPSKELRSTALEACRQLLPHEASSAGPSCAMRANFQGTRPGPEPYQFSKENGAAITKRCAWVSETELSHREPRMAKSFPLKHLLSALPASCPMLLRQELHP